MSQVIIFQNEQGGVSVCYPTGALPIEEVQAKDTPAGSMLIDAADLPQGEDEFFNAWELIDGVVVVNQVKKQAILDAKQAEIDAKAAAESKLAALGLTPDDLKALLG
jgi:hypothetical protein